MVLVFILNSSVPVETYFFLTPQPQKSFLSPLVHELGPPLPAFKPKPPQAEIHLQLLKTFAFTFHCLARKLKGGNESRFVNLISLKKVTDENL